MKTENTIEFVANNAAMSMIGDIEMPSMEEVAITIPGTWHCSIECGL